MSAAPVSSVSIPLAEIMAMLECPVCYKTCRPPYFCCEQGHLACDRCFDDPRNSRTCPMCREPNRKKSKIVLSNFRGSFFRQMPQLGSLQIGRKSGNCMQI